MTDGSFAGLPPAAKGDAMRTFNRLLEELHAIETRWARILALAVGIIALYTGAVIGIVLVKLGVIP